MSLGERIQQLRKNRGLSQEQLADSLNVSRQAISKWETDQSSPEIDNILALSRVFSVTTDELLGNNLNNDSLTSAAESVPIKKEPFDIGSIVKRFLTVLDRKVIILFFTLLCIVAVCTCLIVNYAIDQRISWAVYPIVSVPVGWLLFIPLIHRKYTLAVCILTLISIPFLYLLDKASGTSDWFCGLGFPLAIMGIVTIWLIYLLYRFLKISQWYKAAITVFISGIANVITDYYVGKFTETAQLSVGTLIQLLSCFMGSVILGIIGYMKRKIKSRDQGEAAV